MGCVSAAGLSLGAGEPSGPGSRSGQTKDTRQGARARGSRGGARPRQEGPGFQPRRQSRGPSPPQARRRQPGGPAGRGHRAGCSAPCPGSGPRTTAAPTPGLGQDDTRGTRQGWEFCCRRPGPARETWAPAGSSVLQAGQGQRPRLGTSGGPGTGGPRGREPRPTGREGTPLPPGPHTAPGPSAGQGGPERRGLGHPRDLVPTGQGRAGRRGAGGRASSQRRPWAWPTPHTRKGRRPLTRCVVPSWTHLVDAPGRCPGRQVRGRCGGARGPQLWLPHSRSSLFSQAGPGHPRGPLSGPQFPLGGTAAGSETGRQQREAALDSRLPPASQGGWLPWDKTVPGQLPASPPAIKRAPPSPWSPACGQVTGSRAPQEGLQMFHLQPNPMGALAAVAHTHGGPRSLSSAPPALRRQQRAVSWVRPHP